MKTRSNGLILLGVLTALVGIPILCKKAYRRGRKYLIDKTWEKLNDEKNNIMSPELYNETMELIVKDAIENKKKVTYTPVWSKEDLKGMENYELLATLDNICTVLDSVEAAKKEEA